MLGMILLGVGSAVVAGIGGLVKMSIDDEINKPKLIVMQHVNRILADDMKNASDVTRNRYFKMLFNEYYGETLKKEEVTGTFTRLSDALKNDEKKEAVLSAVEDYYEFISKCSIKYETKDTLNVYGKIKEDLSSVLKGQNKRMFKTTEQMEKEEEYNSVIKHYLIRDTILSTIVNILNSKEEISDEFKSLISEHVFYDELENIKETKNTNKHDLKEFDIDDVLVTFGRLKTKILYWAMWAMESKHVSDEEIVAIDAVLKSIQTKIIEKMS